MVVPIDRLLENSEQKEEYADLLEDEESDEAAESWREMVLEDDYDPVEIKITTQYVTELPDEHDIIEFERAEEVNEREGGAPSHKEPGIVTHFEVGDARYFDGESGDVFARVYGTDSDYGPKGGWLARKDAVSGRDVESIINYFALWDDALVTTDEGWGDYHCVAKTYVPSGVEMGLSEAGGFTAT